MSRFTEDKNLFEIFANGTRDFARPRGSDPAPGALSGMSSSGSHWLGMAVLAIAALSIFGITSAASERESGAETSGPSSSLGFGMIIGTLAIAAAAIAGMNRPATARPLPGPAP